MSDVQLIQSGGNIYLIDMAMLKPKFDMMPMTILPPDPSFRCFMPRDFGPVIRTPSYVLMDTYVEPSPFKFVFLFPLGKKGFVKS